MHLDKQNGKNESSSSSVGDSPLLPASSPMATMNIQRAVKAYMLLPPGECHQWKNYNHSSSEKKISEVLYQSCFSSAYLCKGALESPCTTISPSQSYLSLSLSDQPANRENTPVPPQHTRESKTTAAGQAYGTQAPNPLPSHASYIRDQMTYEQARGGWD